MSTLAYNKTTNSNCKTQDKLCYEMKANKIFSEGFVLYYNRSDSMVFYLYSEKLCNFLCIRSNLCCLHSDVENLPWTCDNCTDDSLLTRKSSDNWTVFVRNPALVWSSSDQDRFLPSKYRNSKNSYQRVIPISDICGILTDEGPAPISKTRFPSPPSLLVPQLHTIER